MARPPRTRGSHFRLLQFLLSVEISDDTIQWTGALDLEVDLPAVEALQVDALQESQPD